LGDIVKGIVARTEGVMNARPPIARADADLFVLMLTEVYGPAAPRAAELSRQASKPAEGAE
jgi:hypothetical protein